MGGKGSGRKPLYDEAILRYIAEHDKAFIYGYRIARNLGISSFFAYKGLERLADEGLLTKSWEEKVVWGKPRRKLYQLTDKGLRRCQDLLERESE